MSDHHEQVSNDHRHEDLHPRSWADGDAEVSAHLSYAAPAVDPIQYGPLTAQGNYISEMDWPRDPTLPAQPISELHPDLSGPPYSLAADGHPLPANAWLATSEPPLPAPQYELYREMINAQYQTSGFVDESVVETGNSLAPDYPGHPAHSTYSPYDGIWAFNPLAVDDNFVYPANLPTSESFRQEDAPLPATTMDSASINSMAPSSRELAINFAATSSMISHAFPASVPIPPQAQAQAQPHTHTHSHPHSHPHSHSVAPEITPVPASTSSARPPAARSLRPERVRRNRAGQSQAVAPRRQGPLSTAQRQKADDMRYYGACWRCRRYKKPCNGPGTCDTCLTSGFRVWPSTIGCYRGNMEDFIVGVMPGNAEQVINGMDFCYEKVPNWKTLFGYRPDAVAIPYNSSSKDKYEALSIKLQATRMAGRGFVELLEILANYQRSRTKPDTCLELACSALNHICDIYHAFVETDTPIRLDATELLSALTRFRTAYSDNWRHFLQLCLSGRRSAWFPAFLCACLNVPLLVVLKDGFVAIPEPARTTLWPNISFLIEDLRNRLYPMGLDLLSALAKGIKPWKLRCWGWKERVEEDGSLGVERDPDGLRLLAGDVGAFDGFAAVQGWLERHRVDMRDGVSFLTTPPFSERNAKMQPIAALAWIFEVNPPPESQGSPVGEQRRQLVARAA